MVTDFKLFQVRRRRSQAVTGPVVMKMKMEMMLILTSLNPLCTAGSVGVEGNGRVSQ